MKGNYTAILLKEVEHTRIFTTPFFFSLSPYIYIYIYIYIGSHTHIYIILTSIKPVCFFFFFFLFFFGLVFGFFFLKFFLLIDNVWYRSKSYFESNYFSGQSDVRQTRKITFCYQFPNFILYVYPRGIRECANKTNILLR